MEHDPPRLNADGSAESVLLSADSQRPNSFATDAEVSEDAESYRRRRKITRSLFAATCVSTFLVGMSPGQGPIAPLIFVDTLLKKGFGAEAVSMLQNGLLYSTALMGILFAHEMGHYLQARRYGIPATLPFFIPFPITPFGTMGAVIVQGAHAVNRKVLFDIAISGPLAGLVLAIPVAWLGAKWSDLSTIPPGTEILIFTDPLILRWMLEAVHGPIPPGVGANLGNNPLLFAGWVGFFITALNLIPIGQLDGEHILYSLIRRKAHVVAILLLVAAVAYMIWTNYPSYGLMVLLLIFMGPRHPPTADDRVPLGWGRILLGWLTLAFIFVGFTPRPIDQVGPAPAKSSAVQSAAPAIQTM